ncbi:transposase [Gluconobacter sp. LMG 1745]|uniref:Transposase n=1 Tax=Gluconobacter cadivus TaxID=2728101 RepID=A0ABR9YXT8_9PROT|nr:transposase [Gluconobacter cadivus]
MAGSFRAIERARPITGHGLSRRHKHPGSSQGGRSRQKRGFKGSRGDREALGRSRGGFGSKVCVALDGRGKALSFTLTPGQAHELPSAMALLDALPYAPRYVVCDRGYASNQFREALWDRGSRPVIPPYRLNLELTAELPSRHTHSPVPSSRSYLRVHETGSTPITSLWGLPRCFMRLATAFKTGL